MVKLKNEDGLFDFGFEIFREKLWLDLRLQAVFLFLVITALFVGAELASVEASLRLLVGAGMLFYSAQIYFSYKASRG